MILGSICCMVLHCLCHLFYAQDMERDLAFENIEYPQGIQITLLLLLCLLNVCQVMFRVTQLFSKTTTLSSAAKLDIYEWLSLWKRASSVLEHHP